MKHILQGMHIRYTSLTHLSANMVIDKQWHHNFEIAKYPIAFDVCPETASLVCVCVCVCVHVHMCACVCACVHLCIQWQDSGHVIDTLA